MKIIWNIYCKVAECKKNFNLTIFMSSSCFGCCSDEQKTLTAPDSTTYMLESGSPTRKRPSPGRRLT